MSTTTTRPYAKLSGDELIELHALDGDAEALREMREHRSTRTIRRYLATLPAEAVVESREAAQEAQEERKLTKLDRDAERLLDLGFSPTEAVEVLVDFARMREIRDSGVVAEYRTEHGCTWVEASEACGVVAQKRYIPALVALAG